MEVAVPTTYLAPEPIPQEQGLTVSRSLLFLRLPAGVARGTGTCPPYPDVVGQAPSLLGLWRGLHVCGKGYLASRKKQARWLTSHRTISVVISPDVHRIRAQPGLSLSYRTYPLLWYQGQGTCLRVPCAFSIRRVSCTDQTVCLSRKEGGWEGKGGGKERRGKRKKRLFWSTRAPFAGPHVSYKLPSPTLYPVFVHNPLSSLIYTVPPVSCMTDRITLSRTSLRHIHAPTSAERERETRVREKRNKPPTNTHLHSLTHTHSLTFRPTCISNLSLQKPVTHIHARPSFDPSQPPRLEP